MDITTYILIGLLFMALVEGITHTKVYKKKAHPDVKKVPFTWPMRIMGIVFWPICLAIFLYNFYLAAKNNGKLPPKRKRK